MLVAELLITTEYEILNLIYAATVSLKHIIDIDIDIYVNIEVVQSNHTMIRKYKIRQWFTCIYAQTQNYETTFQFLLT